jgi:hypothetical protein
MKQPLANPALSAQLLLRPQVELKQKSGVEYALALKWFAGA